MIRASLARAKGDLSAVGAIEASALRKALDKAGYGGLFAAANRSLAQKRAQDYAAERAKLAQLSPAERLSYALERALNSGLGPEVLAAGALIPGKGGAPASSFVGNSTTQFQSPGGIPPRNNATIINDIPFSGHALDQMQNRGLVPSVIENAIRTGSPFATRAGSTGYFDAINNLRVITDTATGRVITVILGAPR